MIEEKNWGTIPLNAEFSQFTAVLIDILVYHALSYDYSYQIYWPMAKGGSQFSDERLNKFPFRVFLPEVVNVMNGIVIYFYHWHTYILRLRLFSNDKLSMTLSLRKCILCIFLNLCWLKFQIVADFLKSEKLAQFSNSHRFFTEGGTLELNPKMFLGAHLGILPTTKSM